MDNSKYLKIENGVLVMCNNSVSGEVAIPDGVKKIGRNAFRNCYYITNIKIPNTVTSIGENAFRKCYHLVNINIPDSVTKIEWGTFEYCGNLTSIEIPNSVEYIGDYAFYGCKNLENINIPKCVTKIDLGMFEGCQSLKCNQIDKTQKKILAYKGFNSDFTCRLFQYRIGKTYHEDKAITCKCGFHACLNPLDVLSFYDEKSSRFALVELSGDIDFSEVKDLTKLAATDIKIIKELTFQDLIAEFNRLNK